MSLSANVNEKANLIWAIADKYKETVRMRKVGQQNEKFAICVQLSRKFFNFV